MSRKPDPDPKAPTTEDLANVMQSAKTEPVPDRIIRLAERLSAVIKARPADHEDP